MRQIALITDQFPPEFGAGKNRIIGLSSNLAAMGYNIHILTIPPLRYDSDSGEKEVINNDRIHIYRKGNLNASRQEAIYRPLRIIKRYLSRYILPDKNTDWFLSAYKPYEQYIRHHGIRTVITSSPSFSAVLLGLKLRRRLGAIKWIMDLRDPWYDNEIIGFSRFNSAMIRNLEQTAFAFADDITVVTGNMKKLYGTKYPGMRIHLIRNGMSTLNSNTKIKDNDNETVNITYTGILYPQRQKLLLKFIRAIADFNEDSKRDIDFHFAGEMNKNTDRQIREILQNHYINHGMLSRQGAVALSGMSDYLLLLCGNRYTIPSKLYDYMSMGKPVIALMSIDNSEIHNIIKKYNSGICLQNDADFNLQGIMKSLQGSEPDLNYLKQFRYSKITEKLTEVLDG
ncbi:MAG: glycosyltransferase [bacterium]